MVGLFDVLTFPPVLHAGLFVAMTLFIAMILDHEIDLPLVIAVPMSAFIAAFGYAVSWLSNFVVDVPMLWALAGQSGILLVFAWLYDVLT